MAGLTRFSQTSAIERVGISVRLEAIRTEKHQTRYQPLQPYMDKDAIVKHMRPWQQMLMFFARTQKEHRWKSPRYRFRLLEPRRRRLGPQLLAAIQCVRRWQRTGLGGDNEVEEEEVADNDNMELLCGLAT
jgi:hypothetical protein